MLVLGIETSCDETAAAVVDDDNNIRSNVIFTQMDIHGKYGGVVPEIASRKHIEAIGPVIGQALEDAHVGADDIDGVAVTQGPGLIGSLLVGLSAAKAFAFAREIPFVGVNHLEGHISAIFLTERKPVFPFIALIVSGGHTIIYLVNDFHNFKVLGQTRDDAAGEAFDKAAKLLDIGYPGGIVIDKLSKEGNSRAFLFPRAMRDSLEFSFSGVKTSLLSMLKKRGLPFAQEELADVASSFQEAIVDVLVEKTIRAASAFSISQIVACGGVASNSRLRQKFAEETKRQGMEIFIPPPYLCTDNAAMVAAVGGRLLRTGRRDGWNLNAVSRWPLELLNTCQQS